MKVSDLKLNPDNPRLIKDASFDKLKKSIKEFPQMMELRPIVVDENNVVLGGNMRLQAIKDLKMTTIPDGWVKRADELTEKQKREFVIKDNSGFGEWDWDAIANEWDDLPLSDWGLEVPTFEDVTLDANEEDEEQVAETISKAKELQQKWQTAPGQLWKLGEHRILCGDATSVSDAERVISGDIAAITFTSPPYNAGVSAQLRGNTHIGDNLYGQSYNDNQPAENYRDLIEESTLVALKVSQYAFINLQLLAGNKIAVLEYLSNLKDSFADVAVWDKLHAAPQQAQRVMDSRFEFVFVFSHGATRAIGTREFRGMVHNVFVSPPQRNNDFADSHAATFPVELPVHFIGTFTNEGDTVFEPFSGSGTTILACEQLGRKCRAIEIAPEYVAVALQRWADYTGKTPELIDG